MKTATANDPNYPGFFQMLVENIKTRITLLFWNYGKYEGLKPEDFKPDWESGRGTRIAIAEAGPKAFQTFGQLMSQQQFTRLAAKYPLAAFRDCPQRMTRKLRHTAIHQTPNTCLEIIARDTREPNPYSTDDTYEILFELVCEKDGYQDGAIHQIQHLQTYRENLLAVHRKQLLTKNHTELLLNVAPEFLIFAIPELLNDQELEEILKDATTNLCILTRVKQGWDLDQKTKARIKNLPASQEPTLRELKETL
jgi:hypothetical protein